ncbi:MAG TPA: glycosyltransferase [Chthoniobacteraceae bacterium]|jgi:glycosyltransferase involved in cell wall biosynthesis|nr:glycosyltransferase [Chthoniobacteraceae bacterium]
MRFSIVTPSFRQLAWLKRAVRSVADQQGVEVEHIVQDAGTGPELEEWVRTQSPAQLFVEKDHGMYDAVNRGLARATGDICAFLNCDEQYLPGTLARVARCFEENPWADAVAGDYLVIGEHNELLAFRKITPPRRAMILTDHLYTYTCAIFFRRRLFEQGFRFNDRLLDVADAQWVCELLQAGHRFALIHDYLTTFVFTGENRSLQDVAKQERLAARRRLPLWMRLAGPALRAYRHVEKLLAGGYTARPISYEIYPDAEAVQRVKFTEENPSHVYPGTLLQRKP